MRLDEPSWWYGKDGERMARRLRPLSRVFSHFAVGRLTKRTPYRSRLPIICVGNFTAGGTGKTPMTLHIARLLAASGEHPAILTRGYGGKRAGPCWIDDMSELAEDVGDEPLLLARVAPTLVAHDRRAGAIAIETSGRNISVIVMDDGLQNPALAKDLTIAIVDAVRGIGNGEVIPSGPLRAPLDVQLAMTDAILVNTPPNAEAPRADGIETAAERLLSQLRRDFPGPVLAATAEAAIDRSAFEGTPLVAFAGIANPARFFALIERLGGRIAAHLVFKDHHAYSETDAEQLLALAVTHGAHLVTTEKDHVRLVGYSGARERLAESAITLPIRLSFAEHDAQRLASLVATAAATGGYRRGMK